MDIKAFHWSSRWNKDSNTHACKCEDVADALGDVQHSLGTSHGHVQQVPLICISCSYTYNQREGLLHISIYPSLLKWFLRQMNNIGKKKRLGVNRTTDNILFSPYSSHTIIKYKQTLQVAKDYSCFSQLRIISGFKTHVYVDIQK